MTSSSGLNKLASLRWCFIVVGILIVGGVLLALGTYLGAEQSTASSGAALERLGTIVLAAGVLGVVFAMLYLLEESVRAAMFNGQKLENILSMLNQNRQVLMQISHSAKLSDTAKAVLFRDMDRNSLREAVLVKLHQLDFGGTYSLIDDIARRPAYAGLAEELRTEADSYRDSTEDERMRQNEAHIDSLIKSGQWGKARAQIDLFVSAFGDYGKAEELMGRLDGSRDQRKGELLAAWHDSVKRQDTDASLEILKELDNCLTPAEGIALQESAREVFRSKLQSMGAEFSKAVSEKRWTEAIAIGEKIVADFPNSKMAQEIGRGMESLHQRAAK